MLQNTNTDRPLVLGIGASAGGLEAFQLLLSGLPKNHGLVLVLVQHLDPDHESLMPELVAAKTASPVHSAKDDMQIEPGHIYLLPPGYDLEISGDRLKLFPISGPRGVRRPIDRFFKSLALEYRENAIAIVLSGTGSDGSYGSREIKEHGGLIFVQDPREAKYDGMPRSVMELSGADVVSEAAELAEVARDYFNLRRDADGIEQTDEEFLGRVMRHVKFRTGHDFSEYKDGTMQRRIAVRMSVLNHTTPGQYLSYLVEDKSEAELLFRALLINVTSFFRDEEHFQTLRDEIIPQMVENTEPQGDVRIWVPGCSTGEEAYSIGILVAEELERIDKRCHVAIFATDIDDKALATARIAKYPDAIAEAVPQALLDRYFKPIPDGYEVGPRLREMVRFSRHSFIKDPPFSKLDLVSCRNVLIYLKEPLQDLACRVFHYALQPGAFLFLGPSENPKSVSAFFDEISSRARLYRRKPGAAKPLHLGRLSGAPSPRAPDAPDTPALPPAPSEVERIVLDTFAPAYLVVNGENEVTFTSGRASRYLAVREGVVTTDLYKLVAPELESTFRRLARVGPKPDMPPELEFQGDIRGNTERLTLAVRTVGDGSRLFVIRDQLRLREVAVAGSDAIVDGQNLYVQQLEEELDRAQQTVRTTVEELETSNEELKSSNEEMMSMNEELQSANEELTTINDELQEKLRDLNQANVDLKNFISSTRMPTVFLSADLHLLRFTPEAEKYFSFTESDVGRPIADLNSDIEQETLVELCKRTVVDRREREQEVETRDGEAALLLRVMPYSPDGREEQGVVCTLQDVTDLRQAVDAAEQASAIAEAQRHEIEQIYKYSPMAMGLIDKDFKYVRLNEKLAEINGAPVSDHIGNTVRAIIPAVADDTEAYVAHVLATGEPIAGKRVVGNTRTDPDNKRIWESDWFPFETDGVLSAVSVNVRDITEQVETAENLKEIMRELEHRVKNMLSNINALVNQAAREVTTESGVFATLTSRIRGLAQTHSLLTAEHWSSAYLRAVIAPETEGVYGPERVTLSGPEVKVTAEATLALGMAIHELATNAAKYGAFSVAGGHVHIKWSRIADAESDRLVIEWTERGGPKVSEPSRQGFGSQLIVSTIKGSLDGDIATDWEPSGLKVVIQLDFNEVSVG